MKKIMSAILVCLLLVGTVFTLVSCKDRISGKYENATAGIILEFDGDNVKLSKKSLFGNGMTTYEGTYVIEEVEENKYTITFNFSDNEEYAGTFDLVRGENDTDGKYLEIGFSPITLKFKSVR